MAPIARAYSSSTSRRRGWCRHTSSDGYFDVDLPNVPVGWSVTPPSHAGRSSICHPLGSSQIRHHRAQVATREGVDYAGARAQTPTSTSTRQIRACGMVRNTSAQHGCILPSLRFVAAVAITRPPPLPQSLSHPLPPWNMQARGVPRRWRRGLKLDDAAHGGGDERRIRWGGRAGGRAPRPPRGSSALQPPRRSLPRRGRCRQRQRRRSPSCQHGPLRSRRPSVRPEGA